MLVIKYPYFYLRKKYRETIAKVRKHKSELGAKTDFTFEFVKVEVMIDSCKKQYREFEKTGFRLQK